MGDEKTEKRFDVSQDFEQVTMGVDVFNDGLQIIVRGWDESGGSTLIEKSKLHYRGKPSFEALWPLLKHGCLGNAIDLTFIDSGNGNFTHRIYHFCDIFKNEIKPIKGTNRLVGINVSGMDGEIVRAEINNKIIYLELVKLSYTKFCQEAKLLAKDYFNNDDRFLDAEALACAALYWHRFHQELTVWEPS